MILEMNTMCNFDENMLCDYLTEKGYRAPTKKTMPSVAGF